MKQKEYTKRINESLKEKKPELYAMKYEKKGINTEKLII